MDMGFSSRRCRQAAFRLRRRSGVGAARSARTRRRVADAPGRFASADPPYVGRAQRWYDDEEVDHAALIASLQASGYAGWALSAAADSLTQITPLCPPHRVCAWVKPIGASTRTFGLPGNAARRRAGRPLSRDRRSNASLGRAVAGRRGGKRQVVRIPTTDHAGAQRCVVRARPRCGTRRGAVTPLTVIGSALNVDARLELHRRGRGSPLIAAAIDAGVELTLAATFSGTRHLERRLKRWHKTAQLCPVCPAATARAS